MFALHRRMVFQYLRVIPEITSRIQVRQDMLPDATGIFKQPLLIYRDEFNLLYQGKTGATKFWHIYSRTWSWYFSLASWIFSREL
ncbi:MAG: hypothetical protein RBG13Loki_2146 [Promethearchaeota archaeon CR_4]|nr:MAG: hypothetical protein RBG13Loki_2146 [Candidatus Lokiarchaeota archaeon CR_4]